MTLLTFCLRGRASDATGDVRLFVHDKNADRLTPVKVVEGRWDYYAPAGELVFVLAGRWKDNAPAGGPVVSKAYAVSESDSDERKVTVGLLSSEQFTFDVTGLRAGRKDDDSTHPERRS
jgi:hypothetical protein